MQQPLIKQWDDVPCDNTVRVREGEHALRDPAVGRLIEFTHNMKGVKVAGRVLKWYAYAKAEATTIDSPQGYCHTVEPDDWRYLEESL